MHRFLLRAATLAALIVLMPACDDRETVTAPMAPETPAAGRTVFLSLSNLAPKAGDEIVVSINTVGIADRIGSFKVRLGHTAAGLEYLATLPQNDGMVIANAVADTLVIVGASGDGFTGSTLASIRVRVADPSALNALALTVEGLTTVDFASQASSTTVERRLFRGLAK